MSPAVPGGAVLRGKIETKDTILRVVAVDRSWADVLKTSAMGSAGAVDDQFVYEATVGADKSFRIEKILPGRAYDLVVWAKGADGTEVRWEGANMEYHRDIKRTTEATGDDRKAIEALVTEPAQFYDKVRVLRIAADHGHATAVVELMRTRDFHSDKGGEVIYRVELWYFENLFGGWAKDKNTEKVLARVRGNPRTLPGNWQFEPGLGGLVPGEEVTVKLPEKPEPRHGIVGGIK